MGRDEYSLVGWGWTQVGVREAHLWRALGQQTPPGSPSWRPGLGQDGGVWGTQARTDALGLKSLLPMEIGNERSLATRPRFPGQEQP